MRVLTVSGTDHHPRPMCWSEVRRGLINSILLGMAIAGGPVWTVTGAQSAAVAQSAAAAQDASKEESDELPEPRELKLKTKDEVGLRAAYFPSDQGKQAITVLIVHEWKGQARPYFDLCYALQSAGCAVLVPDYRGHGGSREYIDRRGQTQRFNLARMSKTDIQNIMRFDLETVKKFLKEENNEGKLNLNALVIIGVGEGGVMGGHWAIQDWKFPSVGRKKQGQDVKALVFVSPVKQVKGIPLEPVLNDNHLIQLPMMIVAGRGSVDADEAETIARRVEGVKKRMGRGTANGFGLQMPDTKLSGARLINDVSAVVDAIIEFITTEVEISDDVNPWVERL